MRKDDFHRRCWREKANWSVYLQRCPFLCIYSNPFMTITRPLAYPPLSLCIHMYIVGGCAEISACCSSCSSVCLSSFSSCRVQHRGGTLFTWLWGDHLTTHTLTLITLTLLLLSVVYMTHTESVSLSVCQSVHFMSTEVSCL